MAKFYFKVSYIDTSHKDRLCAVILDRCVSSIPTQEAGPDEEEVKNNLFREPDAAVGNIYNVERMQEDEYISDAHFLPVYTY